MVGIEKPVDWLESFTLDKVDWRCFFAGLCTFALVTHVRGRIWGPMLTHPLSSRLNMVLRLLRS